MKLRDDLPYLLAIAAGTAVLCLLLFIIGFFAASAQAAEGVPRDAYRYRADLTRQARMVWGLDAPVATFAAQIHQESRWRENAASPVGAQGPAQFMPATAAWLAGAYHLGEAQPTNPTWAFRALATYDLHLYARTAAYTLNSPCEKMWKTFWAYNGGETWVRRDEKLAAAAGKNPRKVADVEPYNAGRSAANFAENRNYPRLILIKFEPRYIAAGFGMGVCA